MVTSTSTPGSMLMEVIYAAMSTCSGTRATPYLLDNLRGRVQVDETLVDAHLIAIPGHGTFTVGGLTGDVLELLGGKTHWALDLEVLVLGTTDQVTADCGTVRESDRWPSLTLLQVIDVAAGQRDTNTVLDRIVINILLNSRLREW